MRYQYQERFLAHIRQFLESRSEVIYGRGRLPPLRHVQRGHEMVNNSYPKDQTDSLIGFSVSLAAVAGNK
jgi:hypothetical protein